MTDSANLAAAPLTAPLGGPTWHRFISPHYDDIALSCGGTVALLSLAGLAPEIAVVFGDEPDPTARLSSFAEDLHQQWGMSAGDVISGRRREESIAAIALGATSSNLPFLDAIYRGPHYASNDQLFGEPAPAEAKLPAWIASAIGLDTPPDPQTRVYAPLAVGGHVDHRHAFAVGLDLARAGWDVWFYEDLPYALWDAALETRLAALPPDLLTPAAVIDVSATWSSKIAAILAYASQLTTVFGYVDSGSSPEEIDRVMRSYANRAGDGAPAERFWRVAASSQNTAVVPH